MGANGALGAPRSSTLSFGELKAMATVYDNLIIARACPPGSGYTYTWTLASRAGEILRLVEERYGPRDHSFTFLGTEFTETGPRCWFSGNCRHVVIQLSTSAMNDEVRALYQLSHECVHLLDPVAFGLASVFEEGVATLLSLEYARRLCPAYSPSDAKYDAAARLAKQALMISPSAIRHLRGKGIRFSAFTQTQIESSCPGLSPQSCRVLCTNFQAWDGLADSSALPNGGHAAPTDNSGVAEGPPSGN